MEKATPSQNETHEIALKLEHYDDIFSDFDARSYSKRSLSVDFLDEIKRASKDKSKEGIELCLFIPSVQKNDTHEAMIKERLAEHFHRHRELLLKEKSNVLFLGLGMVFAGIIFMIAATIILWRGETSLLSSFLVVFLEPAAWFLLWEGMSQILFNSKNINPDLDFYSKMAGTEGHIVFKSY